jgi:hypothetical protein
VARTFLGPSRGLRLGAKGTGGLHNLVLERQEEGAQCRRGGRDRGARRSSLLLFSSKNSDNTAPGGQPLSASPAPTPHPKDDLAIAALPGLANVVADVSTFSDVIARKTLTPEENDAYSAAGASKCLLAVSSLSSSINALVLTVQTSSPEAAITAGDQLDRLQIKYSVQPGTAPPGVKAVQLATSAGEKALIRAHHVHKNTVVRVHVEGNNLAEISKVFDEILAPQLQALPVGN